MSQSGIKPAYSKAVDKGLLYNIKGVVLVSTIVHVIIMLGTQIPPCFWPLQMLTPFAFVVFDLFPSGRKRRLRSELLVWFLAT